MSSIVKTTYAGRVKVAVIFESGKIRPVWFVPDTSRSSGDQVKVSKVNQVFESREGLTKVISIAVSTTDGNDYILGFNADNFTWTAHVKRILLPVKSYSFFLFFRPISTDKITILASLLLLTAVSVSP